ncbi:hypothetical protein [uncultured Eubacterium sp.]|nr:hypothetical protein [uncultured Eubacterium sp.]
MKGGEKNNGYETVKTWTSSKTGTRLPMSESRNINVLGKSLSQPNGCRFP